MHVVNISLSPSVLDTESVTAKRLAHYGTVTDTYTIIVPHTEDTEVRLSANVVAYGVSGSNKLAKLIRIYKKVTELIKEGRCDVLAADQYYFGLLSVFLAKKYNIGFEAIALGFEKFSLVRKYIALYVLRHAHSIRVNSPRLVQFIAEEFGICGKKVHLVPIYVDVESIGLRGDRTPQATNEYEMYIHTFQENYGERFNFLSVNRLVPAKNISLQLQAIEQISKTHPEVFLHILGDGPLQTVLEKEITARGIEDHVKLHGHTTGMALGAMYHTADCFLLTSDNEGWGMVTIEALTASLPIIMTDVGTAGEVIIHGESGMVIPINDVDALVDAMDTIIDDKVIRTKLIQGGQTALQQLLSFEEILVLYKESWEYAFEHTL